jgi:hypothetical protein
MRYESEINFTGGRKIMNMAKVGMETCVQNLYKTAPMRCICYTLCDN